jgi:hypothetical protein
MPGPALALQAAGAPPLRLRRQPGTEGAVWWRPGQLDGRAGRTPPGAAQARTQSSLVAQHRPDRDPARRRPPRRGRLVGRRGAHRTYEHDAPRRDVARAARHDRSPEPRARWPRKSEWCVEATVNTDRRTGSTRQHFQTA